MVLSITIFRYIYKINVILFDENSHLKFAHYVRVIVVRRATSIYYLCFHYVHRETWIIDVIQFKGPNNVHNKTQKKINTSKTKYKNFKILTNNKAYLSKIWKACINACGDTLLVKGTVINWSL